MTVQKFGKINLTEIDPRLQEVSVEPQPQPNLPPRPGPKNPVPPEKRPV